jgi:hypothetical protein
MIRAATALLFGAAVLLLAATGCQKSPEVINPKSEAKDRAPLQPIPPAGLPGKGKQKGPSGGST